MSFPLFLPFCLKEKYIRFMNIFGPIYYYNMMFTAIFNARFMKFFKHVCLFVCLLPRDIRNMNNDD